MTARELESAYSGYRKRREEDWEMVRWGSYYSMVMHSKELELDKVFVPTDAMKPKEAKEVTPDMMMKVSKIKRRDGQ